MLWPKASTTALSSGAVIAALASATQDVAVDAWRIDVADERSPVELLSAIYQFGYRIASIVGGALALVLAARMSWGLVYLLMAVLIGLSGMWVFGLRVLSSIAAGGSATGPTTAAPAPSAKMACATALSSRSSRK